MFATDKSCKWMATGFKTIPNFYECQTCDHTRQLYLCEKCLKRGQHTGHTIQRANNLNRILFCNCGDVTGHLYCSKHHSNKVNPRSMTLHFNDYALNEFIKIFGLSANDAKALARVNQIRKLSSYEYDYKLITEYFKNTNHHKLRLHIKHSWSVCRKDQEKHFDDRGYNRTRRLLLWHGTKRSNLHSILENGFRRPNGTQGMSNGGMFGNGVYFADRMSKSAHYTDRSGAELMFICEVSLGSM